MSDTLGKLAPLGINGGIIVVNGTVRCISFGALVGSFMCIALFFLSALVSNQEAGVPSPYIKDM
jgi:hypothetical protein